MSLVLNPRRPASLLATQIAHEVDFGRFPLLLPAVAAAGVYLFVAAPFNPSVTALGGVLVALLMLRSVAGRIPGAAILSPIALALAALAAGALAVGMESALVGTPMLKRQVSAEITGSVLKVDRYSGDKQRLVVKVAASNIKGATPKKVRLIVRGETRHTVGETIAVKARLFPLRGPVIPGGYDPSRRLYFDGIGATGFAYGPAQIIAPAGNGLGAIIDRVRRGVAQKVMATGAPASAFSVALLVGERGYMDDADVEALRVSGLGHILAISGLHMALFAGGVFAAVRYGLALVPRIALRYPIKKWAAVTGLLAATLYLGLSGASVATVRAYVMLVIALIAILADRPALTMRAVSLAAALLIALDPVSVLEPGFQMSFLAVVALVGAYEWWTGRPKRGQRRMKLAAFLIGLAATSFIAGLATAPATAYHFERLAPLGLVGNLSAMPIFTFIAMPAGIVSLIAMPFGLEAIPLHVMGGALEFILLIAHKVTVWTGSAGLVGTIPAATAILAAAGLLFLCVMTAPWRLLGVVPIAAGLILVPLSTKPDLMVADDGVSVAARGPDGTLHLSPKTSNYAGETFLRADGDPRTVKQAKSTCCDSFGCTLPLGNARVAIASSPRAAAEDCTRAKALVTALTVVGCAAPLVVDGRRLRQDGALLATWTARGIALTLARPAGLVRPWQLPGELKRD